MRGKANGRKSQAKRRRITPACAGKSWLSLVVLYLDRDHPRLCGEKDKHGSRLHALPGSPPPVRGKVVHATLPIARDRITPACAGKRLHFLPPLDLIKDHPRLCGEKTKKIPELRLFAFLFIPYSFSLQYTW